MMSYTLQVLHCAFGFVRSGVVLTAFQVWSRVFLTWGVVYTASTVSKLTTVNAYKKHYVLSSGHMVSGCRMNRMFGIVFNTLLCF